MPFQLMFQSRPVRLIQFLPAKRLFEQERRMSGILTRCFQASQDRLLLLNASRYFDELSLSPLKMSLIACQSTRHPGVSKGTSERLV
jgi:hypothetical protein